MELIYLFIENIQRNISKLGLSFSENYFCSFESSNKSFLIKKTEANSIEYSDNIKSIHCIVGKNGCGKTTILDLLGLSESHRDSLFTNDVNNKNQWFAVYHIKDNTFVIEGESFELVAPFFRLSNTQNIRNNYSIVFEYVFSKNNVIQDSIVFIQDYSKYIKSSISYAYYHSIPAFSWVKNYYRVSNTSIYDVSFYRDYDSDYNFTKFYQLWFFIYGFYCSSVKRPPLSKKNFSFDFVLKRKISIEVTLRTYLGREFDIQNNSLSDFDKKLFGEFGWSNNSILKFVKTKNNSFSKKQIFIIKFLELVLINVHLLSEGATNLNNVINKYSVVHESEFEKQKKYLYEEISSLINNSESRRLENEWFPQNYNADNLYNHSELIVKTLEKILFGLELVDDNYFISDTKIFVDTSTLHDDFFKDFFSGIDYSYSEMEKTRYAFASLFDIRFVGLSSGEMKLFDIFSFIYGKIQKMKHISPFGKKTLILLLDEPDNYLHPEWARRLISNIVSVFKQPVFNELNYQIILTTHSPYIVSDISKNSIICLSENENGEITVKTQEQGFLSRLDELLVDSFYVDSIFGEFSENYVNNLIKEMEFYEANYLKLNKDVLDKLRNKILIISNQFVRQSLLTRLSYIIQLRNAYDKD